MLIGEYTSKIGEKKRVAIPKKIREEIGENMILTRGYENALLLVNKEMWANVAKDIINGSFINKNVRDTGRFLVGSAVELNPDHQGRVVVPDSLYNFAQFKTDVIFVCLVNWVELWDKERWDNQVQYLTTEGDRIAQELNNATLTKS